MVRGGVGWSREAKDQLADRFVAATDEKGQPFSLPVLLVCTPF